MQGYVAPSPRASALRLCAAIRLINSSLSASAPDPSTSVFIIHSCQEGVCVSDISMIRLEVLEKVAIDGSTCLVCHEECYQCS